MIGAATAKNVFHVFCLLMYTNTAYQSMLIMDLSVSIPHLLAGVVVGFLAGDLVSGIGHYAMDTFNIPGLAAAHDNFRTHHENPLSMEMYPMAESICELMPVSWASVALVTLWANHKQTETRSTVTNTSVAFVAIATLSFSVSVGAIQFAHRMAHRRSHADTRDSSGRRVVPRVPPMIMFLQDNYIMLHPDHHRLHHATEVGNYCIAAGTTSWLLDLLLDACRMPVSRYSTNKVQGQSKQKLLKDTTARRLIVSRYKESQASASITRQIGRPLNIFALCKNTMTWP